MAYPPYVLTRAVTVGGAMTLEGASTLRMILTLKSSRPLVWDETGYRFESQTLSTPPSEPGGEVALTLPRTDVAGWRDGRTGAVIDVSAPDSHTHTYTGALTFLTADGKATSIPAVPIGPFVLPEGDGSPVDLDKTVPVGTVAGQALAVPDTWSAIVAAAQQAAQDAAASLAQIAAPDVAPTPDTVPVRDATGALAVGEPSAPEHAARHADMLDVDQRATQAVADEVERANMLFSTKTDESFWWGARELGGQTGAPALSNSPGGFRFPGWLLDPSAVEGLNASKVLPSWVRTVHVDLYWTNAGAGAGDVRWRLGLDTFVAGQTLVVTSTVNDVTALAPAQDVLAVTRLATSVPVSGLVNAVLSRQATHAADTLGNDAAVLGLRLVVDSVDPFE